MLTAASPNRIRWEQIDLIKRIPTISDVGEIFAIVQSVRNKDIIDSAIWFQVFAERQSKKTFRYILKEYIGRINSILPLGKIVRTLS